MRIFLQLNGFLYAIVFFVHTLRHLLGWSFEFGPFAIPRWLSAGVALISLAMCAASFYLVWRITLKMTKKGQRTLS